MNPRERVLASIIGTFIAVAVVGFGGWQFIYAPLQAKTVAAAALRDEIDQKRQKVNAVLAGKAKLAQWKLASLPADRTQAQRDYEEDLSKLFKAAGFDARGVTITSKAPDEKSSPQFGTKKAIYAKLLFNVTARGDLLSLTDWMERFYKLPLLHQIKTITVRRGAVEGARGRQSTDLDITMAVEALVLDGADTRKTLLPAKPPALPALLATAGRTYASIAGKNVFFGPPRVVESTPERKPSVDVSPFVFLDAIAYDEKGTALVTLFDRYTNQDYTIRPRADATGFRVEVTYNLNGKKRSVRSGRHIELADEQGETLKKWTPVLVEDREVIVKDETRYYALHIGQSLADMVPLAKEEVEELGLEPIKSGKDKEGTEPEEKDGKEAGDANKAKPGS